MPARPRPAERPAVLVLGLGNVLLSDEGVGVHAVNALQERHSLPRDVEVLDGGTSGMDLLDTVAGRDALIVCDAVAGPGPPGTVVRIAEEDLPAFLAARLSPHQLGLADLLASLALMGQRPHRIALFGVVPKCLDLGTRMSAEVRAGMEGMIGRVLEEVARLRHTDTAK